MYTEGFEGLGETENGSRRTYVSKVTPLNNVNPQDAEKLLRENERLKKNLEKEKFFNKLLDQEIQELKSNNPAAQPFKSQYWTGNRGVSKGAFYSLLTISLAMAAYICYGFYNDKEFNYLGINKSSIKFPVSEPAGSVAAITNKSTDKNSNDQVQKKSEQHPVPAAIKENTDGPGKTNAANPIVKDSVPNIIAKNKNQPAKKVAAVTEQPSGYDAAEVEAEIENTPPAPVDNRPVIARYEVVSKANFYNSPDENTLRSTFISGSPDKTVEALEEKNGFIFVIYTNDLGYTSKGWLSKKDLVKID